jgi:hypothetical protein
MKIAVFTLEIRTEHSPTFVGFVFMKHGAKEQRMFVSFRWICVRDTRNERTAHVRNFMFCMLRSATIRSYHYFRVRTSIGPWNKFVLAKLTAW